MTIIQTDFSADIASPQHPVIMLVDRVITGADQNGSMFWVPEKTRMQIKARMLNVLSQPDGTELEISFPNSVMPCPVPEVVKGVIVKPLYFMAKIINVAGPIAQGPTYVWLEMELELPSGNYLLSPEFINDSLAVANKPFRFNFEPIDIVSYVVVA